MALDMYRSNISSLNRRLYQEEERSRDLGRMYLALKLVYIKLDEKNHTGRADQALTLAKQALAVVEQHSLYRLIHEYQQREDDLLGLIPRIIGPQMIASYNWRKINQDNAARKITIRELENDIEKQRQSHNERVEEQNAEIEDLNLEITFLRAQIPGMENPRKRVRKRTSSSATKQTKPRIYRFIYHDPANMRAMSRCEWKKSRKV